MPITVFCPNCGKKLKAPDTAAGRKAKCPQCQTVLTLPAAGEVSNEVLDAEPVQGGMGLPPQQSGPETYPTNESDEIPMAEQAPAAPQSTEQPRRPCPMCGEMIPINAVQCRFCHEIFDPALKAARTKAAIPDGDADLSAGEWVLAILCSGIGCIVGIVWMIQGKPKGKKMFGISILFAVIWNILRGVVEMSLR